MRVVFFGTPQFAVPHLEALLSRHEVPLVVTQPDRPRGRGRQLASSPVKERALQAGLPVVQFERLERASAAPALDAAGAGIAVVVAYGLKVPEWLLGFFPRGMVNVHASLLPKYRGAAPVNWALIRGEAETGVTTMRLASRMDAGPVYLQRATPIGPEETAGEVLSRLAAIGSEVLLETLAGLERGDLLPREQDEALATLAPKLRKEDGLIDWHRPAAEIVNLVRGVNPWPGAHALVGERTLKVWRAAAAPPGPGPAGVPPGTVIAASPREGLLVACADGALSLLEVQWEGKKALPAREFVLGGHLAAGDRLG